ncbi:MAG: MFS transporter [Halorientalis sp.]
MTDRWLFAWGLASVAAGAASLLVPLYVVALGGGPVALGVLAATAALAGAPGAIAVGRVADRAENRRSILLAALAGLVATLLALPLLGSVPAVVLANAALWFVVAAVAPVLTMLVVGDAPESAWNRRIGRLNAVQGYGWAGGLVLGMGWTVAGARVVSPLVAQRSLFVVLAACAGGALVGVARTLPRSTARPVRPQSRRVARFLVESRRAVWSATWLFAPNRLYWTTRDLRLSRLLAGVGRPLATYYAAAVLFFAGSTAFWAPLPALLTGASFDSGTVFALYLAASLASAVLYAWAGRLGDRFELRALQAGALGARGLLFPSVALLAAAPFLTASGLLSTTALALALVGATWAVIAVVGTAIVTRLAPVALRAEAIGVYTALSAVAGGAGGFLGGALAGVSYTLAFGVAGALVLAGGAIVLFGPTGTGRR